MWIAFWWTAPLDLVEAATGKDCIEVVVLIAGDRV
jgi:hypothetical protein